MIANPTNDFERVENALASQIQAQPEFQSIKNPDGTPWQVITEDEGDVETMFATAIQTAGLAIIVQTPTGRAPSLEKTLNAPSRPKFFPLVCPVQISEAVIFNRSDAGTGVRVQTAALAVRRSLHLFTPRDIDGLKSPFAFIEALRDRDRHPDTGQLVSSVVCTFHAVLIEGTDS